jgi:hypothetical protein
MNRILAVAMTSIVGFAFATGCADREDTGEDPCTVTEQTMLFPIKFRLDLDILFVIDNSGSMQEEQDSLARNFDRFMAVLENIEGGMPSVHIGVVSTDVGTGTATSGCTANGDNGVLRSVPGPAAPAGCVPPEDAYIKDIEVNGERVRNYTGTLDDTFSCIAQLGTEGCGFEQPLEAMYRALSNNVENAGFLREGAYLVVVFLTDEDDCSAQNAALFDGQDSTLEPLTSFRCFEYGVVCDPDDPQAVGQRQNCRPRDDSPYVHPVGRYVDFLKNLKQNPTELIVAGIIGEASPVEVSTDRDGNPVLTASCTSSNGEAAPTVRLATFLEQFPQRNTTTAICEEDLSDAFSFLAVTRDPIYSPPCLEGDLVDRDPAMAGVQPECQVSDVRFVDTSYQEEYPMPHCDDANGALPCWRLQENPEECTFGNPPQTHLELVVERDETRVPVGTLIQARCAVDVGNSCPSSVN